MLDLPVLNALNTIGGGALGLIEGALLLFLVCDVAPKLGIRAFADYEGTYLLSFFMSHTPRGLCRRAVTLIFTPRRKYYAAATLFQM